MRNLSFPGSASPHVDGILLRAICACVLSGILLAGLWPFRTPTTDVGWLSSGNGLIFGKYGSIVSQVTFDADRLRADGPCTLEIWLAPSQIDFSGTILAFYSPVSRVVPFALRQSLGDLVLLRGSHDQSSKNARIFVDDAVSGLKPAFFTITSGKTSTAVYRDGALIKKSSDFILSAQGFAGQLIIGNAPSTTDNWSGQVKGLAVYDRELQPAEVSQHFADWTSNKELGLVKDESVVARYLFNEGRGSVAHNQVDSATDLVIPERFFVLHEQFLELPWDEFRWDWSYWKDFAINIGGFIPLGFFFRAYFSTLRKIERATQLTIAFGFAVSLTIEVLQAFLPTRDSGMTDIITNTSGTAVGAILFVWSLKHNWFARAGISRPVF